MDGWQDTLASTPAALIHSEVRNVELMITFPQN